MAKINDVKPGAFLRYNNELVLVTEVIHRTPGNLRAFYQAKMKNLKNGKVVEIIRGVGGRPHGMTLDRQGNIYVSFPLMPMVKKIVRK